MNKLLGLTTFLVIVLVLIAFSNSNTVLLADAGEYLFQVASTYGFLTPIKMVIRVKE